MSVRLNGLDVFRAPFNRTRLELKLLPDVFARATEYTFNRTRLELKQEILMIYAFSNEAFNRTRLELKPAEKRAH